MKSVAHKHKCKKCGKPAGRYTLAQGPDGKRDWGWMCLECDPYKSYTKGKK